MAYQSLARKYRPKTFSDLVGQEALTKALSNSIALKREPTAVIFSGVRGIGKTTTARLYAKALNCQQGPTSEPCNSCDSCLAIAQGNHEDVVEIDAASHTGVDDIRALQEELHYVNRRSAFKVYIIDEVHMLSMSAFNALLKTLEEPPRHVVFILATTELQKIPETVIGRCQTFFLKKLSILDIKQRLKYVLERESIAFDEKSLTLIAREGRGSMRDALTFLDQCIALGAGALDGNVVQHSLGKGSQDTVVALLQNLILKEGKAIIKLIDQLDEQGVDFEDLCETLAKYVRHCFILRDVGREAVHSMDVDEIELLTELAAKPGIMELNLLFRTLISCRKDLDGSDCDRFIFENYCLEWCFDPGMLQIEDIQQLLTQEGPAPARSTPRQHSQPQSAAPAPTPAKPVSREKVSLMESFKASLKSGDEEKKKPRL